MSLILDALRKSERARQQTLTGQLSTSISPAERSHLPVPWITLLGLLLLLNAVVLAFLIWNSDRHTTTQQQQAPQLSAHAVSPTKPAIRPLAEEVESSVEQDASSSAPLTENSSAAPQQSAANPSATPASGSSNADVPVLASLPLTFQQSLPALHLDVHGYAANPADRFVIINMQRYSEGDTLKEGPRVIAIIPHGVILDYDGTRFLLPRN